MGQVFGKPFITQEAMHARIHELGRKISEDYQGQDLLVVGVLKGAYIFLSDLVRAIRLPIQIDFLIPKAYKNEGNPEKSIKVWSELTEKVNKRHILLVEDIVDSGGDGESLGGSFTDTRPVISEDLYAPE